MLEVHGSHILFYLKQSDMHYGTYHVRVCGQPAPPRKISRESAYKYARAHTYACVHDAICHY